jgi:hypothetical protein
MGWKTVRPLLSTSGYGTSNAEAIFLCQLLRFVFRQETRPAGAALLLPLASDAMDPFQRRSFPALFTLFTFLHG